MLLAVVPRLAHFLITALGASGRYVLPRGGQNYPDTRTQGPSILVFWHSRTLMHLYLYRNLRIHGLVSRSKDGELLARALDHFGYAAVRGSSSRGGLSAMRGLLRALKQGFDVGLAPDGPRGPACQVQDGVVTLAQLSGAPIRPVAWSAGKVWRAKSWDRFVIPKPFAKGAVVWGKPIRVPRELREEEFQQFKEQVRFGLNKVGIQADGITGLSI